MLSYYCLKCRKNTGSKNPNVARTKYRRRLLSKCVICDSKKPNLKHQEASGLLSSLEVKTPFCKFL